MKYFKLVLLILFSQYLLACASYEYKGDVQIGKPIIEFSGQSLEEKPVKIPQDILGKSTILLFGYVQNSQFDIDRWLIGLDMLEVRAPVYEIPTIKGMFPRMFSTTIDNGMRKGIPKELWQGVVTVYEDGDLVQQYTGNINPNNARVIVVDKQGKVLYFYDRGFSVAAVKEVKALL